jgi:hypothetical protein
MVLLDPRAFPIKGETIHDVWKPTMRLHGNEKQLTS